MPMFTPPDTTEVVFGGRFWIVGEGQIIQRSGNLLPEGTTGTLVGGSIRAGHFNGRSVIRAEYEITGMAELVACFWTQGGQRLG